MRRRALTISLLASSALAVACSSQQTGSSESPRAVTTANSDSSALARLYDEVRTLAHSEGCSAAAECRVAPVGAKGCGGPKYYIAYCARTTDSAALFRKLGELETAEKAYNRAHNVISDCSMLVAPQPRMTAGRCTLATAP
ncbi:MAG: hypothetical protein M3068_08140 [Gemmatimonadota bacterium]|nr:hypothetical protein [Gemmatimonadota bacterium]